MQKIPVTIRDLNVLFTAALTVSTEIASAVAGKLNSGVLTVDWHSACMIRWYNEEDVIFFDYSAGARKYAAVLFLRYDFPVVSGKSQQHILRMLKKHAGFRDYEEIQCMLIVPEQLGETEPESGRFELERFETNILPVRRTSGRISGRNAAKRRRNAGRQLV